MALQSISPSAQEAVSFAEAKAHIRVDSSDDDTLINSLILTAQLHIEAALGLALITQSWRLVLDCWPLGDTLEMPLRPLVSVAEIRLIDGEGGSEIIDAVNYSVDVASTVPRITSRSGYWPSPGARNNGIEIDFVAGYGEAASAVPFPIRQALLMLIAHWYENREPTAIGTSAARIPDTVSALLQPYAVAKL